VAAAGGDRTPRSSANLLKVLHAAGPLLMAGSLMLLMLTWVRAPASCRRRPAWQVPLDTYRQLERKRPAAVPARAVFLTAIRPLRDGAAAQLKHNKVLHQSTSSCRSRPSTCRACRPMSGHHEMSPAFMRVSAYGS